MHFTLSTEHITLWNERPLHCPCPPHHRGCLSLRTIPGQNEVDLDSFKYETHCSGSKGKGFRAVDSSGTPGSLLVHTCSMTR